MRVVAALAATVLGLAVAARTAAADLIEEPLTLKAQFRGGFGSIYHDDLEALVVRPNDDSRHPLALINHGMTTEPDERHDLRPSDMLPQAQEFANRGWAVVIPMRRDYGKSEGHFSEDITGDYCGALGFADEGWSAAADLRETIRLMRDKPYVDASRIISVGVSGGGFATVALTADPPPGLVAGISFAGGEGSSEQGMYCSFNELTQAFWSYGRRSRVPMLWVYAENDHFFGPRLTRDFFAAFNSAGGQAELKVAPPFGDEGHYLFSQEGIPIWTRYVDDFLAEHRLAPEPVMASSGGKANP